MTTSNIVLDLIEAFRWSKTLFAALELGVFDGARPEGCKELTRLLDACVSLGLLEKRGGDYVNTPVADRYLRSDSPDTLSGYIRYSNNALYPMWGQRARTAGSRHSVSMGRFSRTSSAPKMQCASS